MDAIASVVIDSQRMIWGFELSEWMDFFGFVASISAAAASLYLAKAAIDLNKSLTVPAQVENIPEFVRQTYFVREFQNPIEIPSTAGQTNQNSPNQATRKFHSLREARIVIEPMMRDPQTRNDFWLASTKLDATGTGRTWENQVAYEAGLALNDVGAAILFGAVPIENVFSYAAMRILQDWCFCNALVQFQRTDSLDPFASMSWTFRSNPRIGLHRRYAEWLAVSTAIYMNKYWKGPTTEWEILLSPFAPTFHHDGSLSDHTLNGLKQREIDLRVADSLVIPSATNKRIEMVLYG